MDCKKIENSKGCACTYTSCGRHGVCCDCLRNHLSNRQLPGCCFPEGVENDRSFASFVKTWKL